MLSRNADLSIFGIWAGLNALILLTLYFVSPKLDIGSLFILAAVIHFISYPHVVASFFRVYGTGSFKQEKMLRFFPLMLLVAVAVLYKLSLTVLMIIFAATTIHHHVMQQVGLLKLSQKSAWKSWEGWMFYLIPVSMTLFLLSDARGYNPPGGGDFSWMLLPESFHLPMLILSLASLLLIGAYEFSCYRKSRRVLVGKYINYGVFTFTWFLVPLLSRDWIYVYAVGSLSHGWYHVGLSCYYINEKDPEGVVSRLTRKKWLWYAPFFTAIAGILGYFYTGSWIGSWPHGTQVILTLGITMTISHYWFDAHIWKLRKKSPRKQSATNSVSVSLLPLENPSAVRGQSDSSTH